MPRLCSFKGKCGTEKYGVSDHAGGYAHRVPPGTIGQPRIKHEEIELLPSYEHRASIIEDAVVI